jgi:hypothetical protein
LASIVALAVAGHRAWSIVRVRIQQVAHHDVRWAGCEGKREKRGKKVKGLLIAHQDSSTPSMQLHTSMYVHVLGPLIHSSHELKHNVLGGGASCCRCCHDTVGRVGALRWCRRGGPGGGGGGGGVCRYWAASGSCYYGDQCNYLHTSGGTLPPLPSHNLASPSRGIPPSGAGDLLTGTHAHPH